MKRLFLLFMFLPAFSAFAADDARSNFELELDPYYSSLGYYLTLSSAPMENLGETTEWKTYLALLRKMHKPRTLVLEASINPLPILGTELRRNAGNFYNSMKVTGNLNLVEAATAGFEEPWALSMFLGNVLEFESVKKSYMGKRHGYAGLLLSGGNFNIKESTLIRDQWFEAEIKLKGDQQLENRDLHWSFLAGMKFHDNPYIADAFYFGIRRSRADFNDTGNFFINNSGYEYTLDIDQSTLEPLRHYFMLDKKYPLKGKRFALSMGVGFMWTSNKKYSGPLSTVAYTGSNFTILFRPNLAF